MALSTGDKVRSNRLRRAAERRGLVLERSRRRDPAALGYGTFQLRNAATGDVIACRSALGYGLDYGLDLDEVEAYLNGDLDETVTPSPRGLAVGDTVAITLVGEITDVDTSADHVQVRVLPQWAGGDENGD